MIQWQVISKVMASKDYSLIEDNFFTESDFDGGYEKYFTFISDHYKKYGNVPDDLTFYEKFPDAPDLEEVGESDNYLVAQMNMNRLMNNMAEVTSKFNDMIGEDLYSALDYIRQQLNSPNLQAYEDFHYVDAFSVESKQARKTESDFVNENTETSFIPTGFPEIDNDIMGFSREEEFAVVVARTNQGKSWVLGKFSEAACKAGFNVMYLSPEMSYSKVGYRLDTLRSHLSNKHLVFGRRDDEVTDEIYQEYVDRDEGDGKLLLTTPDDFGRKVTVSKLRQFTKKNDINILMIDGISYVYDEREKRGDNETIRLTNISEDLMRLSVEEKVAVVISAQVNRGGIVDKESDDTPDLDSIRGSDGMAMNASKVFSIRQRRDDDTVLIIEIKKNRSGEVDLKYKYYWDIDHGKFEYFEGVDDENEDKDKRKSKRESKTYGSSKKRQESEDVF